MGGVITIVSRETRQTWWDGKRAVNRGNSTIKAAKEMSFDTLIVLISRSYDVQLYIPHIHDLRSLYNWSGVK